MMILLGAYDEKGYELQYHELFEYDLNVVQRYHGIDDYTKLTQMYDGENREGFVIKFSNGDRCKIKYQEYCRLHFLMTEMSTTRIWEALRDDRPISLDGIPDEMFDKIKSYRDLLWGAYKDIECECIKWMRQSVNFASRKDYARYILQNQQKYSKVIFAMLDGKNYSEHIWKLIKPEYRKIV
jgi:hypothetical protein